jgi:hypothetical protein
MMHRGGKQGEAIWAKLQVVTELLSADKPTAQVAKAYRIHPNTANAWKKTFLEKRPDVLAQDSIVAQYERRITELEQSIGKKEVEIALLSSITILSGVTPRSAMCLPRHTPSVRGRKGRSERGTRLWRVWKATIRMPARTLHSPMATAHCPCGFFEHLQRITVNKASSGTCSGGTSRNSSFLFARRLECDMYILIYNSAAVKSHKSCLPATVSYTGSVPQAGWELTQDCEIHEGVLCQRKRPFIPVQETGHPGLFRERSLLTAGTALPSRSVCAPNHSGLALPSPPGGC